MFDRQRLFRVTFLFFFAFLCSGAFCDSYTLQMYKQQFSRVDLAAKAQLLEDSNRDRSLSDSRGEFYEYALQFALDNFELLGNDPDMIRIVDTAISGLRNTNYSGSVETLWELFLKYPNSRTGAEIMITIGKLGRGNKTIIENVNNYLLEKNLLYKSGESVNYAIISAGIAAAMELGDSSSYPVLFEILCAGYPEIITFEAYGALELIPGNFMQFLFNVIEKNPPVEKLIALRAGIYGERLNLGERAQLAELALEQSLAPWADEDINLSDLRYTAVLTLTPLRWARANALAIRNYYRVLADFQRNSVSRERFLEAIALLGAVGNSDAALVLVLQLGLINVRMERTGGFDAEVTLAIIQALGLIGDKAAFNQLFYVISLPYPENIIAAAKEAVDRLRW